MPGLPPFLGEPGDEVRESHDSAGLIVRNLFMGMEYVLKCVVWNWDLSIMEWNHSLLIMIWNLNHYVTFDDLL